MSELLHKLRTEIDTIDEQIADLLLARQSFVHQVGELKKRAGDSGSFIRPDREAEMIRRIVAAFDGTAFHPLAAAQLWRIIIGAALSLESPLTLSVKEGAWQHWQLVREYFGNFIPVTHRAMEADIIADCLASPHTIGVLGLPQLKAPVMLGRDPSIHPSVSESVTLDPRVKREDDNNILRDLLAHSSLKIFAKLPFVPSPEDKALGECFLFGQVTPASTGQDETLCADETGTLTVRSGFHPDAQGCIGCYAVPMSLE